MAKAIDIMEDQALLENLDVFATTRDPLEEQLICLSSSLCSTSDN